MRLSDLLSGMPDAAFSGPDRAVSCLVLDSRKAAPGCVFFALPGVAADGAKFAAAAVAAGAVAVVAGTDANIDQAALGEATLVHVGDARRAVALAAARFSGRQPETMAAVTGTSGKTSIVTFLRQIWAAGGYSAASIGTVGVVAPGIADYGSLTTPDPIALHETLAKLADLGVTHAAMEASSHGIEQRRLDGVRLKAAGFTNLSRDHLDYHPTMEAYLAAKLRLFETLLPDEGIAVIDADEATAVPVGQAARARGLKLLTVGRAGDTIRLERVETARLAQHLTVDCGDGRFEVTLPMAGVFQVSNALVAAGLAIATGMAPRAAVEAIGFLTGAEGRLQPATDSGKGASVFIDYAHKPGAIRSTLDSLRPFTTGRLIAVIGAGGDRDPGKRELMGQAAAEMADVVIVTDDNPRSEDPAEIRKAVLKGAPQALEIGDRREAIHAAIAMMEKGDVVIIAGKGHETGQLVAGVMHPFSDLETAREALAGEPT
ncbi:MAG: UDP-N-acetylmuramoyl-L-alanyl-D-glutamate--2,6-diaminopimelate ligase [Rhodobiaceae bacterium]|nr:UDP-N-acetylmuramoyl-L-alanyl-D-glutamate--2,6-diaminopimelate ligase [Rhodobiaceae bacterium]MCC0040853.1 UDP-N-acetylmuramoyl-L-alanyl-D-glutamate--2,6-diaminopimelate ligase [Rhodobiaceae bacterium]